MAQKTNNKNIRDLQKEYAEFKEKSEWEKFHQPNNIAMSISIEAPHFWLNNGTGSIPQENL